MGEHLSPVPMDVVLAFVPDGAEVAPQQGVERAHEKDEAEEQQHDERDVQEGLGEELQELRRRQPPDAMDHCERKYSSSVFRAGVSSLTVTPFPTSSAFTSAKRSGGQ